MPSVPVRRCPPTATCATWPTRSREQRGRPPFRVTPVRILDESGPTPDSVVADHVAFPEWRPTARAFVRLNVSASADGGAAVSGVSGGLGNRDDHAVFAALRAGADGVLVGLGTVIAEHYHAPDSELQIYVVAD